MAKGQAEQLLPIAAELMENAGKTWADLDAVAVATGPGNFTGIRISVAAARGLALALRIPAVGVSVLEAIAFGATGPVISLASGRGETLFFGKFGTQGTHLAPPGMVENGDLTGLLEPGFQLRGGHGEAAIVPPPETYARIAAERNWAKEPRPAPLYLRPADAALPREMPPTILP